LKTTSGPRFPPGRCDNKKFALACENLQHLTARGVTFADENLRKKYLWLDAKINGTQLHLSFYSEN